MARKPKYKEPVQRVSVTLPESAIAGLDELAQLLGFEGRSELIARIGLGEISLLSSALGES